MLGEENPGVAVDILRRFFYNALHNLWACGVARSRHAHNSTYLNVFNLNENIFNYFNWSLCDFHGIRGNVFKRRDNAAKEELTKIEN